MREVDVTQARTKLGISQTLELVRGSLEGLAHEVEFGREDRQFARLSSLEFAVYADKISQVEAERKFPRSVSYLILANENLDFARPVLDRQEDEFTLFALKDDTSRDANLRTARRDLDALRSAFPLRRKFDRFARHDFIFSSANVPNIGTIVKSRTPGIDSHRLNLL